MQGWKCGYIFWPPVSVFIPQFYLYCDFPLPCFPVLLNLDSIISNFSSFKLIPPSKTSHASKYLLAISPARLSGVQTLPHINPLWTSWRSPSLKWRVIIGFTVHWVSSTGIKLDDFISRTQSTTDISWFHLQVELDLFRPFLLLSSFRPPSPSAWPLLSLLLILSCPQPVLLSATRVIHST